MNTWKMASRNVMRNRRRTGVAVGAMTFALTVELLYSGLIPGMLEGMEADVVDLEMGDMQIFGGNYLEKPSLYETIPDPGALLAKLDALGYPASPRLMAGGLAAAGENSSGVAFRGVDVARDGKVSLIGEKLAQGQWLDPQDPKGVVIGKQLARTLGVKPGDEMVVLTQASDGSMANDLFTVRGILLGIAQGTDRGTVYLNEASFRDLLVFPEGAHQIMVRRPKEVPLADAAVAVRAAAAEVKGPLKVMTWKELSPILGTMLESTNGLLAVVAFIFFIAVGILVLNAMLMTVFERIREFGVLKAIGTGPGKVFSLILAESFLQALIALVLGTLLALPGMWYLSEHGVNVGRLGGTDMMGVALRPVWHGVYRADTIGTPVFMMFFVVFLAVLYPALKAAFIQPIEAMHHQ